MRATKFTEIHTCIVYVNSYMVHTHTHASTCVHLPLSLAAKGIGRGALIEPAAGSPGILG